MNFTEFPLPEIKTEEYVPIGITLLIYILYRIVKRIVRRYIDHRAKVFNFDINRVRYTKNITNILLTIIMVIVLAIVWGNHLEKSLSVYFASFFTVAGVALFAQWSVLSNITSALILFFSFPLKAGAYVKIQDGDNSIIGWVLSITIFNIQIEREDGTIAYYPNNLAIQKAIIDLPEPESKPQETPETATTSSQNQAGEAEGNN